MDAASVMIRKTPFEIANETKHRLDMEYKNNLEKMKTILKWLSVIVSETIYDHITKVVARKAKYENRYTLTRSSGGAFRLYSTGLEDHDLIVAVYSDTLKRFPKSLNGLTFQDALNRLVVYELCMYPVKACLQVGGIINVTWYDNEQAPTNTNPMTLVDSNTWEFEGCEIDKFRFNQERYFE